MTSTLTLRVGDRLPSFTAQALDRFGDPIPLTGYDAYLVIVSDTGTVFGQPSPYIVSCPVVDPLLGTVRYDWLVDETFAAVPGTYGLSVRFVLVADPTDMFEVPNRRTATLIVRPGVTGYEYLVDGNGELVLTTDNQPIEI